jgi:lipopolysaccharide/colanic/teichoic acid biosynthesis glycosyltransferase
MLKRLFDLFLIFISLPFLIPVFFIVAWLVRSKLGSPIFFTQVRPGKDAKPFEMIKFRSMRDAFDDAGNLLPDSDRITPFGHFLRSTSLDELPELWNVFKGDMSLVGPRPLLMEYLPLYSSEQYRRHDVRPGVTGWAQVNGRNAISWEDKFKLDVWYVNNRSFWLDLKIIYLTFKKVVVRDGISAEGEATMHKFTGSREG